MTKEIYITPEEISTIQQVITENEISGAFKLIFNSGGGIGSTLDLEFSTDVNGREATIHIPISGVENW